MHGKRTCSCPAPVQCLCRHCFALWLAGELEDDPCPVETAEN